MQISPRKDRKYTIVSYQKSWAIDFEAIKKQFVPVFGDQAIDIMHVGSTAVFGMCGKPTIDELILVRELAWVDALNNVMAELGYQALGEYVVSNSRLFAREEDGERLVNVHCCEKDHPHAREMIVMRNFLRNHPDEAKAYADLKIDLYTKYPDDYFAYRKNKDPYLTKLKMRAVKWWGDKPL
ncbi:MAG: GrpB family protein [Patescibacteria group bacterium]